MRILLVDAANVVGSVPDGWWRDRPGAARRLHDALAETGPAALAVDAIELILEGRARAGVPAGTSAGLTTVHAPASGDDAIVERCAALAAKGAEITLASADRGLLDRVTGWGVRPLGPRTLRERLGA